MLSVERIISKAKSSGFYLKLLNFALARTIPFNRPHGVKIVRFGNREIHTSLPYKRRNQNHIKGIHACALATLAEFSTGFLLLCNLDMKRYRLIMKRIEMEYFYQGKKDATATFRMSDEWFRQFITNPLNNEGVTMVECEVGISDSDHNHLCTGKVIWQIKDWKNVKTTL